MRKLSIAYVLISIVSLSVSNANNVTVSNVNFDGNTTITFDLSWENSWRTSTTQPYNYDGVWIFVKVRNCYEKNLGSPSAFAHVWLDTNPANHSATNSVPGGEALTIEMGTTDVAATPRGMGIFLYQTNDVTEATDISTSVTLEWDRATQAATMAAINDTSNYDVKVFAVEMVYVPQGAFYLGDGASSQCFHDVTGGTTVPFYVDSEESFTVSGAINRACDSTSVTGNPIDANYPKGYDAFWIMKYEISQYQYAEFLNTLTQDQAENRTTDELFTMTTKMYVMSNNAGVVSRQGIALDPQGDKRTDIFQLDLNANNTYNETSGDGLGIACNYLSLRDVLAYLDWAALRPLTEMEYEKACRGLLYPQVNEYAWGSVAITDAQFPINSGNPDEQAYGSGNGLCNYMNTTGGPLRVGFAATSSTNRVQAGCSYYGVMELSGNVAEPYMSFYNDANNSNDFEGQPGDGELDSDGYQDVTGWPSHIGDADFQMFLNKGGAWDWNNAVYNRVSRRNEEANYDNDTYVSVRDNSFGGRGGR